MTRLVYWLSALETTIDISRARTELGYAPVRTIDDGARRAPGRVSMRIAIGSDHAGFHLKEHVKAHLLSQGHEVVDVGTATAESVDYPQFARDAARLVAAGEADRGVLACGSGVGVAIVANKVGGVRAVNAHDAAEAEMARRHNDANVVTLSGARLAADAADAIVRTFLRTRLRGRAACPPGRADRRSGSPLRVLPSSAR